MASEPTQDTKKGPVTGVVIGVLIVFLVIILGGLYMWGALIKEGNEQSNTPQTREIPNREPETPRADADIQNLNTYSSSDELDIIESDLENTQLELDAELNQIEAELNASGV